MHKATVVIPNWNGMAYLEGCLSSLESQTCRDFDIIMVDNGSTDESVSFVREHYPRVRIYCLKENTGFCHAVNLGIRKSDAPYVILLNNDTVCDERMVEELLAVIRRRPDCFSVQAKMVQLDHPDLLDDAGDYYCALGWAFARGKGKDSSLYRDECRIFASCAGAAVYRRDLLDRIGLLDEKHFAYLEDMDLGYRARIAGYENRFAPASVVYHAGSGASGSRYNAFKVRLSSRNSIYLIYKNMPLLQILLNLPLLTCGFAVKALFFAKQGLAGEYLRGLLKGFGMCNKENKVIFRKENLPHYIRIQLELWINVVR